MLDTIQIHLGKKKFQLGIRRRCYEKEFDHIGTLYIYHETSITLKDIKKYVEFELNNFIFTIGTKTFQQTSGLPMGGYLSAPLACIDTMSQEHLNPLLWFCCRYKDNIIIIVPKLLTKTQVNEIHEDLNKIYRPDLTVELKAVDFRYTTILEYVIYVNKNEFNTEHWNKTTSI